MTNAVFLFDPQTDEATLSGGNWQANDASLDNVQNNRYWRVARTASLLPADTQFNIDCRSLKTAAGFAIILPNATPGCRVRVSAYSDASYAAHSFQTTWLTAGVAAWKDDERAPIISAVFVEPVTARYWRVEIDDPDNLRGHIDVARFFLGAGLSPSFNYGYGASLTFKNNSLSSSTLAGGTVHWRRVNPRTWQCAFNYLPDEEVFGSVYDFLRFVGFDREVFILPEPGDVAHAQARSFFGTITQLDPLSQVVVGRSSFGFGVEEIVAHAAKRGDLSLLPFDRLTITDFAPLIITSAEVTLPADSLVLHDYAVSIITGVGIAVPVAALIQADFAPMTSGGVIVNMPAEGQIVADFAPMVGIGQLISVPATAAVQSDYPPQVLSGVHMHVPASHLSQADFDPLLGAGAFVLIADADLTRTRDNAPSIAGGARLLIPSEQSVMRDFATERHRGFGSGYDAGFN